nr:alpha/beta hydrolase [Jannaschia sp. Os4]
MLAAGSAWRGVGAHLDRPLLRPDLPGHGRTPYAGGDWMSEAVAVARAAGRPPFDVVGHSIGGCVALALMAEGLVRRAVLIEPVTFAAAGPAAREAHVAEMAPYEAARAAGDAEGMLAAFHGLWGDVPLAALPQAARVYMRDRVHLVAETAPALVDDVGGVLDRLPDVPVTFVAGERAAPVVRAIRDGLAARLPRLEARVIAGAGHMAPLTHPEAVARVVAEALA